MAGNFIERAAEKLAAALPGNLSARRPGDKTGDRIFLQTAAKDAATLAAIAGGIAAAAPAAAAAPVAAPTAGAGVGAGGFTSLPAVGAAAPGAATGAAALPGFGAPAVVGAAAPTTTAALTGGEAFGMFQGGQMGHGLAKTAISLVTPPQDAPKQPGPPPPQPMILPKSQGTSAVDRRLAELEEDPMFQLTQAKQSLASLPKEQQAEFGPTIDEALKVAQQRRKQGAIV